MAFGSINAKRVTAMTITDSGVDVLVRPWQISRLFGKSKRKIIGQTPGEAYSLLGKLLDSTCVLLKVDDSQNKRRLNRREFSNLLEEKIKA